jgi:hypothetical protein
MHSQHRSRRILFHVQKFRDPVTSRRWLTLYLINSVHIYPHLAGKINFLCKMIFESRLPCCNLCNITWKNINSFCSGKQRLNPAIFLIFQIFLWFIYDILWFNNVLLYSNRVIFECNLRNYWIIKHFLFFFLLWDKDGFQSFTVAIQCSMFFLIDHITNKMA